MNFRRQTLNVTISVHALTIHKSCYHTEVCTEHSNITITVDSCHSNVVLGGGGHSVSGSPTLSISHPCYCYTVNTTTGGWGVVNHIASDVTVTFSAVDGIPCYGDTCCIYLHCSDHLRTLTGSWGWDEDSLNILNHSHFKYMEL